MLADGKEPKAKAPKGPNDKVSVHSSRSKSSGSRAGNDAELAGDDLTQQQHFTDIAEQLEAQIKKTASAVSVSA